MAARSRSSQRQTLASAASLETAYSNPLAGVPQELSRRCALPSLTRSIPTIASPSAPVKWSDIIGRRQGNLAAAHRKTAGVVGPNRPGVAGPSTPGAPGSGTTPLAGLADRPRWAAVG